MFRKARASIAAILFASSMATAFADDTDPTRYIAQHGTWIAATDGISTRIMDQFNDGSSAGIEYFGPLTGLLLKVPTWQMTVGERIDVKVDIDGHVFNGSGAAIDATTILIRVESDFIERFYRAQKVQMVAGDDTFTLTTLGDASATLEDARVYHPASAN